MRYYFFSGKYFLQQRKNLFFKVSKPISLQKQGKPLKNSLINSFFHAKQKMLNKSRNKSLIDTEIIDGTFQRTYLGI